MKAICYECGDAIPMDEITVAPCGAAIHWSCGSRHADHCTDLMCQEQEDPEVLAVQNERDTFLAEVITTAVEGGIQYWAEASQYSYNFPSDGPAWASVRVRELGAACVEPGPWVNINPHALAPVLNKIASGQIKNMSKEDQRQIAGAWAILDSGDIDGYLADQIIQAACFGEVRYG